MKGFEYPTEPHLRRHGPEGYQDYESYRDWLRDEFMFRCVYCLYREQWCDRGATFNVEHFVPVATDPIGKLEYANLLYGCGRCNNAKRAILGVPDPCKVAFAEFVRIRDDGNIEALNMAGEALVKKLKLDSERICDHRFRWMRILASLELNEPELYQECMSFPADLPDLRTKRAPSNTKPESPANCYFALRERGELQTVY